MIFTFVFKTKRLYILRLIPYPLRRARFLPVLVLVATAVARLPPVAASSSSWDLLWGAESKSPHPVSHILFFLLETNMYVQKAKQLYRRTPEGTAPVLPLLHALTSDAGKHR